MMKRIFLAGLALLSINAKANERPNIIVILADDIGYADFGCYGANKISTPNIDRLASKGVIFKNAYAPASTSSPSRYALLTGRYAFRKGVGILPANAAMVIDTKKNNLPKMLKQIGYKTGIVGKWHLGLGSKEHKVNFNKKIEVGMRSVGFDYSFIFPATNDRVPTIFIENDRTVNYDPSDPIAVSYKHKIGTDPTGKEHPELLKLMHLSGHDGTIVNGIGRIGWMSGGKSARWKDESMSNTILKKALNFINSNKKEPFFLYYATHQAHEPRVPSPKFRGKSKAGIYGDVIEEFDSNVGEIVEELKRNKIFDNTIIIITSDNGPMIKEGYDDGALENINGHNPFAELRGMKYSLYEGGTKVPFIACWGNKIKKPFIQEQRFCFVDILATVSKFTNISQKHIDDDSKDASQLFIKKDAPIYREYIVTQDNGGEIAIRKGNIKYVNYKGNVELYDLSKDPSEKNNLIGDSKYQSFLLSFGKIYKSLKN